MSTVDKEEIAILPRKKRGSVPVDFSFAEKNVVPKSYNGSGQVIPKSEKPEPVKK